MQAVIDRFEKLVIGSLSLDRRVALYGLKQKQLRPFKEASSVLDSKRVNYDNLLRGSFGYLWAVLRFTIGLPVELVIKIMLPTRQWKMFTLRPPAVSIQRWMKLGISLDDDDMWDFYDPIGEPGVRSKRMRMVPIRDRR